MGKRILYIEPFDGGSHAAFTRTLTEGVEADWTALTLPGRHWKWRARGSAVYLVQRHGDALSQPYDLIVAGSFLPLSDLLALVPPLAAVPSVLYFHENQLAYPVQGGAKERDFHYGFSQMVSALAATRCVFNSQWNLESFIAEGRALLRRMPDARPPGWMEAIEAKSLVIPVPLELPDTAPIIHDAAELGRSGPTILWNHRWEYDKAPQDFFAALEVLASRQTPFKVIVCGERFSKAPEAFETAREWLGDRILHWGWADSRRDYLDLLASADIAVSTAIHEFFGVSMLEATHFGAHPLVPDRLSYPELFPAEHRYKDVGDLVSKLEALCARWQTGQPLRADRRHLTGPYIHRPLERFGELFDALT